MYLQYKFGDDPTNGSGVNALKKVFSFSPLVVNPQKMHSGAYHWFDFRQICITCEADMDTRYIIRFFELTQF